MQRIGFILVSLCLGLVLIQCGGDKAEQPAAEAVTPVEKAPMTDTASTEDAMAEMGYDLANGEAVYKKYCFACHDAGIAGAAKHTDAERWEESAAKGIPTLVKHVTEGYTGKYGMLPPKGACMECSEQDITDAVHYQLKMGGSLK